MAVCTIHFACKKGQSSSIADVDTHKSLDVKIQTTVQDYIDLNIFSGIVLVADKGDVIYHKAFGLADRNTKRPNELNTLFDIGSMNKTFTSIVLKQLASEGKLGLVDNLMDHIPGFEDPFANKITINHLLDHQSGFGDYHTNGYFDLPKSERKLQAIVDRAKSYELNFEPGTEQEYSNLGYVILGAVIEKVSGKSYFTNVKERIIEPLDLRNTYLDDFGGLTDKIAKGYYFTRLGKLAENESTQDVPNPDGGFLSTTKDVMKFYRSYYYDTVLLSDDIKSKDPGFEYLRSLPQGKATGAAGGFEGFNTALFQVLSDDFTIIVFANMDEPVAENVALDILSISRGEIPKKPKLPAIQNIRIEFEKNGIDHIAKNFDELTTNFHPEDPKDIILNSLGYAYLNELEDSQKAIELFKLNTQLFPNEANCWDSYGEGLKENGDTKEAILAYRRALEIDPDLESAIDALNELK